MKKEILIVTIALGNDGAERILSELASEWISKGHKVSIVQTHSNRYGCEYELEEGIERIYINATSSSKIIRCLQEVRALIKLLKDRPHANAVSFLSASSFNLALSSWFVPNRIIFSERNNPRKVPIGWHQQMLRNFAFYFANVCVFQTEDAKSYFSKSIQDKGIVIPNPVKGKLPNRFTGERKKVIVTACRLHPQKNLAMMIDAFSLLVKDFPDYQLVIYGKGILEDELRAQIKRLGLERSVLLPGFASDILEQIKDASMYVSSSDFEGISNSMLEAMGMGLPTVVTDCPVGGARMVIQNNENGILVPVGDTQAMYEGMKKVLAHEEFSQKLSDNAYLVRERFPIVKIAQRWIDIMK